MRIMVFNRSITVLSLIAPIFKQAGYAVTLETFGIEVAARIKATTPDLVVLDCPPGLIAKGWLIIQQIRATSELVSMPIVLCASSQKVLNLKDYLRTKGVFLLLKPYDTHDLLRLVKHTFGASDDMQDPSTES
jgi:DNA-binding response OmpR family regulator